MLDLALSGLDDRTIDLARAHGDAGEADFVQTADRVDIAAVLAADEDFELRIDGACISNERADHLLDGRMDADERMTLEEFLVDIERQEAVGVVAGDREGRLGEVVGAERSEAIDGMDIIIIASNFGAESRNDFAAGDGGRRGLDHRAECVRNCEALLFLDLSSNLDGDLEDGLDFRSDDDERDFDFGFRMFAFLDQFGSGIQNGLDLHLGDFRVRDGHTDRAVTEHRVLFLLEAAVVREELVQRGVEQTDGHAIAVHNGHAVFEVIFRELIDGFEGFLGLVFVIAEQNFLNVGQTIAEEHVLRTEQANATGALVEGGLRLGGFRIGADVEGLDFLAPVENRLSGFFELARNGHGDFAEVDFAGRTRDRDVVTTFNGVAVAAEGTGGFVDRDLGSADDGGDAPCGRHNGGMGNLRTGRGQNTAGSLHALHVFLRSHDGHEDSVFLGSLGGECFVLREADFTTGSARRSGGTLGDHRGGLAVFRLDLREEELFETLGVHFADGFFFREDAFLDEVVGDHGFSLRGTLAIADLEEVQRRDAVDLFDRELGILHVAAFVLELLASGFELFINGVESGIGVIAERFDREAVADTGDDVFALRLEQNRTIEDVVLDARNLIAGEVNARCRTRRAVTEDHFLNVDGGAEAVRNTLELAGEDGALVVPRTENGFCGGHNLFLRILREFVAILDIDGFVALDEFREVIGGQVEVGLGAFLFLEFAEGLFERIFAILVFDLLNNIAVHLEETTIAVTPETRGVANGQRIDDLVGEADVEDRVHHTRHRIFRAGTGRNEQRVVDVAEFLAGNFFHLFQASHDLVLKGFLHVAVFEVVSMERRHVHDNRAADVENAVHQIKAIALAAEELFELVLADALKLRNRNAFVEEISVFVLRSVKHVRKYSMKENIRPSLRPMPKKAAQKIMRSMDFVKHYRRPKRLSNHGRESVNTMP